MAKEKKMVEAITSMEEDFAQWYTDVVKKAELCDYASVKGCMVIKPDGYAIWENIQKVLDAKFKETGVENVAMPMFIPESLLKKEKENVVEKLFSDDIKSFLKVVCDNDDIACFDEAVEYYDELKRKTDKIIKAEFDYVTMPKDEQLERIKQYLMKQYQADKVELTLKEEKDLIGGFVLKVGDHVYDNSLSGKMRKLQQKLTWR